MARNLGNSLEVIRSRPVRVSEFALLENGEVVAPEALGHLIIKGYRSTKDTNEHEDVLAKSSCYFVHRFISARVSEVITEPSAVAPDAGIIQRRADCGTRVCR